MQALNHTVFGTLVALTITEPAVAIPVALGSHFVLDAIPHYGEDPKTERGTKGFIYRIIVDLSLSLAAVLFFLSFHRGNSWLIIFCVIASTLPDFFWLFAPYVRQKGPIWGFFKFHKHIQTESKSGIYLELVWFVLTFSIVVYKLH